MEKGNNVIFRWVATANILFATAVFIILFFAQAFVLYWYDSDSTLMLIAVLASSAIFAFGTKDNVDILHNKLLLFMGEETGFRVSNGLYFTFWGIFRLDKIEEQNIEKKDVVVPTFDCQDINGKPLKGEGNGDWEIEDSAVYKLQPADKMEGNLISLIRRTAMRRTAQLPYKSKTPGSKQIQGEELGELVLNDGVFKRECKKYGIKFSNLIVDAIAADLKQEGTNAYSEEIYKKEIAKYPAGHKFSHAEIEAIQARVQVQTDKAERIITNADVIVRHESNSKRRSTE